jgi:hypothetical protein
MTLESAQKFARLSFPMAKECYRQYGRGGNVIVVLLDSTDPYGRSLIDGAVAQHLGEEIAKANSYAFEGGMAIPLSVQQAFDQFGDENITWDGLNAERKPGYFRVLVVSGGGVACGQFPED